MWPSLPVTNLVRLEDVQYRFALADTDEKLQTLLNVLPSLFISNM